jgi:putative resolvase
VFLPRDPYYATGAKIRNTYDVSASSLRSWADQGKIRTVRSHEGSGKRLYLLSDVTKVLGASELISEKRRICYARVSSAHQRADLERQCTDLRQGYPGYELLQDVGSGLNWRRPGLLTLLDAVCQGDVAEVVVTHRDRLARIGVELIEWLFQHFETAFIVMNQHELVSETEELRDDLLAVVTFFVARNNGKRSAANRKRRASTTPTKGERPKKRKVLNSAEDPPVTQEMKD